MGDSIIQVVAEKREVFGRHLRKRRKEGWIPANIVSKGKPSLAIELPSKKMLKLLEQAGYTQAVQLQVGRRQMTALVNEVSFAPVSDIPQHVVFVTVRKGETVTASVPLVLQGLAPGEQKGLIVLQTLDQLEVIAPALQIPEQLTIDISGLEEDGDAVRVSDVKLPQGITTEVEESTPVVRLERSQAQTSEESVEEESTDEEGEESESEEGDTEQAERSS